MGKPTRLVEYCFSSTIINHNHHPSRSSHRRCSMKTAVLKNFAIFTGKYLCWSLFLITFQALVLQSYKKEIPTQVFSCEYCETFKNTYFEEHLRTAASLPLYVSVHHKWNKLTTLTLNIQRWYFTRVASFLILWNNIAKTMIKIFISMVWIYVSCFMLINPFHATGLLLYPLKTS